MQLDILQYKLLVETINIKIAVVIDKNLPSNIEVDLSCTAVHLVYEFISMR